jgi:hypothetical protein
MGYKSQVAFYIKGPTEHITTILTTIRLTLVDPPSDPSYCLLKVTHDNDGVSRICMYEADTKWYSSFEGVQYLEEVWDIAQQYEADYGELSGAFIRIGEDDKDIETRYFGADPYGLLSVYRTIEFGRGFPQP